jgi:zinc protease
MEVASRFVEPAARLLGTLVAHPTFDAKELDKLLRQAAAELVTARDDDTLLAARALRRRMLAGHPHARPIAGTRAGLSHIDREAVVDHHRRHYTRDNAIVGISGDIDEARAASIAELMLADLPAGTQIAYPVAEPDRPAGKRLVIVDKPERTQVQLGLGTLGTHPRDPDHIPLVVANTAFGGTFSSRLTQEVRVKRGWSYGVSSGLVVSHVRELFSMWSAPAVEDAADCLRLELEMLQAWHERGIDAAELERAKQYLTRSFAFEIDTPRKRLQQSLERALIDLPEDYHARFVEHVSRVTLAEANAAVQKRIDPSALWVSTLATEPEVGDARRSAIPDLVEAFVEPYDLD